MPIPTTRGKEPDRWLTIEEILARYTISKMTLWRWLQEGTLHLELVSEICTGR